jgi:hypothetical protein
MWTLVVEGCDIQRARWQPDDHRNNEKVFI